MTETVSVDLHQKFYIPFGLKKRVKPTTFDLQDVLYDCLQETDIKTNPQGLKEKAELSHEEIKKRNKLAMKIEIRYDTDREIEFSSAEVKMLSKLLVKPLSRDYHNIVIAQALAYIENTEDESLYFRDKYEKQPKPKFKLMEDAKLHETINNLQLIGVTPAVMIRGIIVETEAHMLDAPGKITSEFLELDETELDDTDKLDEIDLSELNDEIANEIALSDEKPEE